MTDRVKDQPFDERAALGELERFRAEIEHYRRQRQEVHQEFEQFISSFPTPESVFPPEQPEGAPAKRRYAETASNLPVPLPPVPPRPAPTATTAVQPASPGSVAAAPPRTDAPAPPIRARRPAAAAAETGTRSPTPPPRAPSVPDVAASDPVADRPGPKRSRVPVLILLIVLAAAAGLWTWNARRADPRPEVTGTAVPAQPPPAAPAPDAETTPPAAPPTESVVSTVRPAWVRVIADGERVVERELAADARVTFTAEKSIVIRTGDAGAVRLSIRGEDQGALGRDGQVLTRTFTVPEKTPR